MRYRPGVRTLPWINEVVGQPGVVLPRMEVFDYTDDWVILFVDCAPATVEQYETIAKICKKLIILDHHETNMRKFAGRPNAYFDMNESGASLAWKACYPSLPLPFALEMIKRRDLWKGMDLTVEAFSASFQDPLLTPQNCSSVWKLMDDPFQVLAKINEGMPLLKRKQAEVEQLASMADVKTLAGIRVAVVMVDSFSHISDVGALLAKDHPAAAMCLVLPDGKRKVSLRSAPGTGVNVAELAEKFGGGGHKNAASFVVEGGFDELFGKL